MRGVVGRPPTGIPNGGTRSDGGGEGVRRHIADPMWKVRSSPPRARQAALTADYEGGVRALELAQSCGTHRDEVRRCLAEGDVARRWQWLTAARHGHAVGLYPSGLDT